MAKRAIIITGPQSHGNRFLTDLIASTGIPGSGTHQQPWDRPDGTLALTDAPPFICLFRSMPHAGEWEALAAALRACKNAGYAPTVLRVVRPQDAAERAQVTAGHATSPLAARHAIARAWLSIDAAIHYHDAEHLTIDPAETNNPAYRQWLAHAARLPNIPAPAYRDENRKHRENLDTRYTFSFDWTTSHAPHWRRWLSPLITTPFLNVLTIGAAEGRSELWLLANILQNPGARLTTVEPGYCPEWHARLTANWETHPDRTKWDIIETPSHLALARFLRNGTKFHAARIDADHEEHAAYADILNTWQTLHPGGLLIVDDYNHRSHEVNGGVGEALRYALPALGPLAAFEAITNGGKGEAFLQKPAELSI